MERREVDHLLLTELKLSCVIFSGTESVIELKQGRVRERVSP